MQFDPMIADHLLCQPKARRRIGVAQTIKWGVAQVIMIDKS
jgi:hypothetical protein